MELRPNILQEEGVTEHMAHDNNYDRSRRARKLVLLYQLITWPTGTFVAYLSPQLTFISLTHDPKT